MMPPTEVSYNGFDCRGYTLTVQSSISDADELNAFSYVVGDSDKIDGANTASLTLGDDDAGKAAAQMVYLDGNGVTETVLTSATSVLKT